MRGNVTALLFLAAVGTVVAEDWAQWRGPSRSGALKSSPPLLDTLEGDQLKLLWEVELPLGTYRRPYYASPVASAGKAYLHISPGAPIRTPPPAPPKPKAASRKSDDLDALLDADVKTEDTAADLTPSAAELEKAAKAGQAAAAAQAPRSNEADDALICVDVATGKEVWRFEKPGGPSGMGSPNTPCVTQGRVYFVGTAGTLYSVDAATGKEAWRADASGGRKNAGFAASPLALDGKVIAGDAKLLAFDAATGARAWEADADTGNSSPAPWTKDGRNFVIALGRDIACVDAADGKVVWRVAGVKTAASPAIAGDTLLAMQTYGNPQLYKMTAEGAEMIGGFSIKPAGLGHQSCTPSIDGNLLYVWDARKTYCYDLEKQSFAWEGDAPGDGKPSPILADGKVICSSGGRVLVLNAADGKTLFTAPVSIASCSSTCLSNGKLLVNSGTHLRCYDLAKGRQP